MLTKHKQATPQLMRLFRTAGLLDVQEWRQFSKSQEKHKHIVDVLQQSVSIMSFKELLTADISFKLPRDKNIDEQLYEGLMTSGMIQDQELMQLLTIHQPPIGQLLNALGEDGALKPEMIEILRSGYSDENPAEFYQNLVRENYLTGPIVARWLRQPQARTIRRMALYQCLHLMQQNGHMSSEDMNAVVEQLDRQTCDSICQILRRETNLESTRVFEMINEGLTLPSVGLADAEINPALFGLIPLSLIRRQMIIPFSRDDLSIGIATSDPLHTALAALLHWATGLWPQMTLSGGQSIIDKINCFQQPEDRTARGANDPATRRIPPPLPEQPVPKPMTEDTTHAPTTGPEEQQTRLSKPITSGPGTILTDNVSAVQLVSSLIESSIQLRTTDIHLEPAASGLNVRFRIDGELHRIMVVPPILAQPVVSRIKVLANMDVTERRRPQDGHFELNLEQRDFDFRISTLPAVLGEKVVIRILDTTRVMNGLDDMGLLESQIKLIKRMITHPHGLILVTGPTGSGKTTTLYSVLNELNTENRNLITIEDPVEYQLEGINQVQVDPHINLTFSEGLRSILRQDPDIIMVGEIRDGDTASITMRAAMTGHLVLSTLHTNTAISAIGTLTNLGTAPFMIARSLLGVISQRLVRTLCENCRRGKMLNATFRQQLELSEDPPPKRIFLPVGCETCLGSGYVGRTGVYEVIMITEKLRPLIASGQKSTSPLEAAVREEGMISLHDAAREKVLMGTTSIDEISGKILLDI